MLIFSYQKKTCGWRESNPRLISVPGHIPGRATGRFSVFSRSSSRPGMPSFAPNPTFTPLKTPFWLSYGVVSYCLSLVFYCFALFPIVFHCLGLFLIVRRCFALFFYCAVIVLPLFLPFRPWTAQPLPYIPSTTPFSGHLMAV